MQLLPTNKQTNKQTDRDRGRSPWCSPCPFALAYPSFLHICTCLGDAIFVQSPETLTVHLANCAALPTAAAGIFPLISVAIELNLACLIYLINFFHFFVHWRMPIKLAVSAPQMLAFCCCCCCWLVWVLFQLLALCRLFFLISIVFKWLQFFFYPTEQKRDRERERGIVKESESLPY